MTDRITSEFLKYRKVIASLLSKIRPTASAQDIEDIMQDTFINTYQSSLKQEIEFPKAFMVKTAVRLASRSVKLAARNDAHEDLDQLPLESDYLAQSLASDTEKQVISRQDFTLLCEAVENLPEQCRRVFIYKKIYGLSQREIATKIGIAESTVEKHVAKGLYRVSEFYNRNKSEVGVAEKVVSLHEKRQKNKGAK